VQQELLESHKVITLKRGVFAETAPTRQENRKIKITGKIEAKRTYRQGNSRQFLISRGATHELHPITIGQRAVRSNAVMEGNVHAELLVCDLWYCCLVHSFAVQIVIVEIVSAVRFLAVEIARVAGNVVEVGRKRDHGFPWRRPHIIVDNTVFRDQRLVLALGVHVMQARRPVTIARTPLSLADGAGTQNN
jgi:hypothetical protein